MRRMKKLTALMLAVLLMMQLLPVSAAAENPEEVISDVYTAPVYHTVSFTAEGEEVASLFVNDGAAISRLPDAPEVEGKTFTGWFVGETPVTAETAVTEDLTVTAVYTETEAPAPENGALAEGKDYYLTGKLPDGIVEVTPVTVEIAGAEVLAACDVRVTAARKLLAKGEPGQSEDGPMQLHFYQEAFASEIVDIYRMADAESSAEYITTVRAEDGWVTFDADASTIYAVTKTIEKTIRVDEETYKITVTYDRFSGIPYDADLEVSEVSEDDYTAYLAGAADALGRDVHSISYGRLFNISIVKDGVEYQPGDMVSVTVELVDAENVSDVQVVHFENMDSPEKIPAATEGTAVRFETDEFSVFSFLDFSLTDRIINAVLGEQTGTLYENDDIILSGSMPALGVVEAERVDVAIDGLNVLLAYDIKIYSNPLMKLLGINWQPSEGAIQVTMKSAALDVDSEDDIGIYHIAAPGAEPELVTRTHAADSSVVFSASGFSVYAVTDDTYFHTYKFYVPVNAAQTEFEEYHIHTDSEGYTTFTQIIKDAAEGLVVPQLPSFDVEGGENATFAGWYLDTGSGSDIQNPTLSPTEFDFNNIPAVTSTEEYHLYARFTNFAYVIFHEQYNGATNTWPITETRRGELEGDPPSASIVISDVTVSYDDSGDTGSGEEEYSAPAMAFRGWTLESGLNDEKTAARENADIVSSPITINENTDLYPVFVHINWLTFISGPAGSGATYYPPEFYYIDEGIDSFADYIPSRRGYSFAGWYTETDSTGVQLSDAVGNLTTSSDLSGIEGLYWENGKLMLSKNVSIYAKWTEAESSYTVVIWRQTINDDKNAVDADKTYDFAESFVLTANTGASVNTTTPQDYTSFSGSGDYEHYHYNTENSDTGATVDGNGTTVLNVYYDRDLITFTFYVNDYTYTETTSNSGTQYGTDDGINFFRIYYKNNAWRTTNNNNGPVYTGTRYTRSNNQSWQPRIILTGLYGQTLAKYGYSWPSDYTWATSTSNMNNLWPVRLEFSYDINGYRSSAYSNPWTMQYYFQNVDGSEPDFNGTPDATRPYNNNTGTSPSVHDSMFLGLSTARYKIGNNAWVTVTDDNRTETIRITADTKMYLVRDTETLTFIDSYDNSTISTVGVLFGQTLSGYKPSTDPESSRVGYTFTGWYYDSDCTTPVDWTKTMPSANMSVYAGWDTEWYLIQFDPNGGAYPTGSNYSTWMWKQFGTTELINEYENTTRDYLESLNGTWYYAVKDRDYYGLSDEWESREDDIQDRTAYYTQDISDPAIVDLGVRYKYSKDAFRYANWYEVEFDDSGNETGSHLYNFTTQIDHDMTLRLHWKQVGTYYIRYDAGDGSLDEADSNEDTFKILDSSDYSDHSYIVITRTAHPPERYNFVGWTIRGGDGTVYSPGQAFEFESKYAVVEGEKEILILDAVYTRISLATIVYDANGGTIDSGTVDYGSPVEESEPGPVTSVNADGTQATISNLINNSGITLSDGTGFSMTGATLVGWNTEPDGSGDMFTPGGDYYVDTEEPVTLYAVWVVKVYFHLNESTANANFGGEWDPSIYTKEADDLYSAKVYINNPVEKPDLDPVFFNADNPENLFFHYWGTMRYAGDDIEEYDFSQPITEELHLYAYWDGPIKVPVHAVDASQEMLADKDSEWLTTAPQTMIEIASQDVSLAEKSAADVYAANVPAGYAYAFATVKSRTADLQSIDEENAITSLYYNSTAKKVYVKYKDSSKADAPLADTDEVYLVYYKNPLTLDIGYKLQDTNGVLSNPTGLQNNRPQSASAGEYDLQANISSPRAYAGNNYTYYSYAIGSPGATSASQLQLITSSSNSDSNRPQLRIRNTWRGYQYSVDGGNTWINCGYDGDIQLYVIYYDRQPRIITIGEITVGTTNDVVNEYFHYRVEITNSIDGDGTIDPIEFDLKSGETRTITAFYWTTTSWVIFTTEHTQTVTVTQTSKPDFETDNSSSTGTKTNEYIWSYTTSDTNESPSVIYTNTHKPISFPVHVALITGGSIVNSDATLRNNTTEDKYTLTLTDLDETVNLTAGTLPDIFTGDTDIYTLAGIVYGTEDDSGVITVAGMVDATDSVTYGNLSGNIYELYLNDDTTLLINEEELNQSYNIYFVYYEMPHIYYVKEAADGSLTQIVPITRNGETVTLNGSTVAQGSRLNNVNDTDFVISQSASGAFRVPPDLDYNDRDLYLDYVKLAAGPGNASNASDLEAVTTDRVMTLKVIDSRVQYSIDGGNTWSMFASEPTVYVIYKEKGYNLRITKTVEGTEADKERSYTVTISSTALTEDNYSITGYEVEGNPVYSVPAESGVITLTVTDGSDVTLSGIQEGTYTFAEEAVEYIALSAIVDGHNQTVNENLFNVSVSNADRVIELTNTRQFAKLTITKQVTGDFGDRTKQFTFTLVSVENETTGTTYTFKRTAADSTVTTGTVSTAEGSNTFTLADGDSIELELPMEKDVVISEENGVYTTTWTFENEEGTEGSSRTVILTKDSALTVENHLDAVAPTGYHLAVIPYILLFLAGTLLLMIGRRKRRGGAYG